MQVEERGTNRQSYLQTEVPAGLSSHSARNSWVKLCQAVETRREIIEAADSSSLEEFHSLLTTKGKLEEFPPLALLQEEMRSNDDVNSGVRFICVVVRDPVRGNGIVSGVYGSVSDGVLAIRWSLSELVALNPREISYEAELTLFEYAQKLCRGLQRDLWAVVTGCTDNSEQHWNYLLGVKRVYMLEPGSDEWREVYYAVPSWSHSPRFGEIPKHFQLHVDAEVTGDESRISKGNMLTILTTIWSSWHIGESRSGPSGTSEADGFSDSDVPLKQRIEEQLQGKELRSFSKVERENLTARGVVFHHLQAGYRIY